MANSALRPGLCAAILVAAWLASPSAGRPAAAEVVLDIDHSWREPSEMAALDVLSRRLAAEGIGWHDVTIAVHEDGLPLTTLLQGKHAPHVFNEPLKEVYDLLQRLQLDVPLTALYSRLGALEAMPAVVREAITVNGEVEKAPLGVHLDGMVFYNRAVAAATGVDPERWRSFDDLFADFDRVAAAGYIPIAAAGEDWQILYLFHVLVAATSGGEIYERLFADAPDRSALDTPAMRLALTTMRRFRDHADPRHLGRPRRDTTRLVIDGKALLEVQGDWAKGEFLAAGRRLGVDFDCTGIPGAKGVVVSVDAVGFRRDVDDAVNAAEEKLAGIIVDRDVALEFSLRKGSTPVFLDIPRDRLDRCGRAVRDVLENPGLQHLTPLSRNRLDWQGAIFDITNAFWINRDMTADMAIAALQRSYAVSNA